MSETPDQEPVYIGGELFWPSDEWYKFGEHVARVTEVSQDGRAAEPGVINGIVLLPGGPGQGGCVKYLVHFPISGADDCFHTELTPLELEDEEAPTWSDD